MIKRTLEISSAPARLSVRHRQLVIARDGAEPVTAPIEDIGLLIIDQQATSYSHNALTTLAEAGAAVALCGANHLPAALVIPVVGNALQAERQRAQIAATKPLAKQLWRRLVAAKLARQADTLEGAGSDGVDLRAMARRVRSGDPENLEAQGAQRYWPRLFGKSFRRDPQGDPPNHLLNYGYAVIRAAAARALVGAGLLPAFGIQHSNRGNPFALADDLIEPFRPFVDAVVVEMVRAGLDQGELDRERKAPLLALLNRRVAIGGTTTPLSLAFGRVATSLAESFLNKSPRLILPERLLSEDEERAAAGLPAAPRAIHAAADP